MYEVKRGYKVVVIDGLGSYSVASVHARYSYYAYKYTSDKWTYAEYGPMMLFDHYGSATEFAAKYSGAVVSNVVYVPMRTRRMHILPIWWPRYRPDSMTIFRYWSGEYTPDDDFLFPIPDHTVFAAAVRLDIEGRTAVPAIDFRKLDDLFNMFSPDGAHAWDSLMAGKGGGHV